MAIDKYIGDIQVYFLFIDNVSIDERNFRTYDIDVDYVEKVLDLLSEQASLVGPVYLPWLCFRADYAFGLFLLIYMEGLVNFSA